tara:strand:- start:296 stop:598 length:303 start_codon:yes stop_codon:yes gene_type:complete
MSSRIIPVEGGGRTAALVGHVAIDETTAIPIALAQSLMAGAEEARNSGQHRQVDNSRVLRLTSVVEDRTQKNMGKLHWEGKGVSKKEIKRSICQKKIATK